MYILFYNSRHITDKTKNKKEEKIYQIDLLLYQSVYDRCCIFAYIALSSFNIKINKYIKLICKLIEIWYAYQHLHFEQVKPLTIVASKSMNNT